MFTVALLVTGYSQTLDKTKLDRFFDRLAEKNKAMGSLIIAKGDNAVYTRSIGFSHNDGTVKKPLSMSSKFRIGSVTKMYTAVMVFQLIEEEKLTLSDRLHKFMPQIPNADKITIEHILAHRSGIPGAQIEGKFRARRSTGITKDEMVAELVNGKPNFEPGEKYEYSNAGYFLLGIIVEKITGKPYAEALQERIVSRAGLTGTYAGSGNVDTNKNESFSYKYNAAWQQAPDTHGSFTFGSGFLVSTAPDMAKFIKALFDGKLVSHKSLDLMMQNKMGMVSFTYNGKTFYGHTGGIDGFGVWLVYQPEEKLALSYATNGKVYPVTKIVDNIFDIYYNKPFTVPAFESFAVSTEVLDKYVGVYSIPEAPVKFTVTREGETLFVQMTNQSSFAIEATAENKFRIESPPIEFLFDTSKKTMTIIRNGRQRVLTKEN